MQDTQVNNILHAINMVINELTMLMPGRLV